MTKYGFVYIWYDSKQKKYYIGSHWGLEDDGYICSSNRMRDAYKRRPKDFRRRILARIYTNREDLLNEEQRWFSHIKKEEFGIRYYNINGNASRYYWWINESTKQTVTEKISKTLKGQKYGKQKNPCKKRNPMSEETKRKIGEANKISQLGNTNRRNKNKG
jgi:hypothetical protein